MGNVTSYDPAVAGNGYVHANGCQGLFCACEGPGGMEYDAKEPVRHP